MHDFKKLKVWQKSRLLVKDIYIALNNFPKEELFGLVSQIKRSAISIPSNLAEGCGRDTKKQFDYFLNIALGSTYELETQLILSQDLNYLENNAAQDFIGKSNEIAKMILGLKRQIKNTN